MVSNSQLRRMKRPAVRSKTRADGCSPQTHTVLHTVPEIHHRQEPRSPEIKRLCDKIVGCKRGLASRFLTMECAALVPSHRAHTTPEPQNPVA